ncbi:MAG: hypothetical protein KGL94_12555 [Acidobacteriota bacterium]|nr:hypothetical protein [Acidobacteriota bacterium]
MKTALLTCAAAIAALVAAGSGAAAGNSPVPVPGTHSCGGQLVAISNHASGAYGASGNANASAGPGYFLGSSTAVGIADYRAEYCGS